MFPCASSPEPARYQSPDPAQQEDRSGKHCEPGKSDLQSFFLGHEGGQRGDGGDDRPESDRGLADLARCWPGRGRLLAWLGLHKNLQVRRDECLRIVTDAIVINEALDAIKTKRAGLLDIDVPAFKVRPGAVSFDLKDHDVAARSIAFTVDIIDHHLKRRRKFNEFCHFSAPSIRVFQMLDSLIGVKGRDNAQPRAAIPALFLKGVLS